MIAIVETVAQAPGVLETLSQIAIYLGIASLIGGALVVGWVFQAPPRATRVALAVAWLVAALGTIGIAEIRRSALELDLGGFLGTPLGIAFLIRAVGLLVAHEGIVLVAAGATRARRPGAAIAAVGAMTAAYGHVTSSHASIGSTWFEMPIQWLHIVSMGVWIGGLIVLLAGLPGAGQERARAVRRFSTVAGIALVLVVVTGMLRTLSEVGGWSALIGTSYGRMVILKSQLLLGVIILGAVNRYRHVPVAERTTRPIQRLGGVEVAIAAVLLGVTGLLSGTVPASEALEIARREPEQTLRVQTQPVGGPTLYTIEIDDGRSIQTYLDPEHAGRIEIHVTYFDADGTEASVGDFTAELARGDVVRTGTIERFSAGHLIIGARLTRGAWTLTTRASWGGRDLRSSFDVVVRRP